MISPYDMEYFMDEMMFTENEISNLDSPFTELFSLFMLNENFKSTYTAEQLRALHLHSENAVYIILQGMQDVGQIFGAAKIKTDTSTTNFGYFVSALANLSEALVVLKENASYMLRQNGVIDY